MLLLLLLLLLMLRQPSSVSHPKPGISGAKEATVSIPLCTTDDP
jgi:hypothetical protein